VNEADKPGNPVSFSGAHFLVRQLMDIITLTYELEKINQKHLAQPANERVSQV